MTAWVDDPDLSMSITSDLINALADAVYEPDQIKPIVLVIGLHAADMPWRIARETWLEVVREAAQHGKMRALVEHMRDHFAMLEERMTRVLSTSRAGGVGLWYQCANPKQARLLGSHSQKAMIDRYELSDDLDELMSPAGRPILLISGDPGSGKTHSRYLLRHIMDNTRQDWEWAVLDIAEMWPVEDYRSVNAREFIGELSAKLGLSRQYDDVTCHTEAKRIARELVTSMVGRFRQLPPAHRMIFIDGLDRSNMASDVAVAIAHIARNIETGELARLRMVLTGYRGEFSPAVVDVLNENRIAQVGVTYVEQFFKEIGDHVGKPCTFDEARAPSAPAPSPTPASMISPRSVARSARSPMTTSAVRRERRTGVGLRDPDPATRQRACSLRDRVARSRRRRPHRRTRHVPAPRQRSCAQRHVGLDPSGVRRRSSICCAVRQEGAEGRVACRHTSPRDTRAAGDRPADRTRPTNCARPSGPRDAAGDRTGESLVRGDRSPRTELAPGRTPCEPARPARTVAAGLDRLLPRSLR